MRAYWVHVEHDFAKPPERIFARPEHPRTRQFLDRIIEAGRL